MKPLTTHEKKSLIIIFLILFAVSLPNFIVSIRRARDQIRRDDLGALQHALDLYYQDFKEFPLSTSDGKILACKNDGDLVTLDEKGKLKVNYIPCEWGKDSLDNFTPGGEASYITVIPGDPQLSKGVSYRYVSDGARYQLFIAQENDKEIETDDKIAARNIMCGSEVCNTGRNYACPIHKTLEECELEFKEGKK